MVGGGGGGWNKQFYFLASGSIFLNTLSSFSVLVAIFFNLVEFINLEILLN